MRQPQNAALASLAATALLFSGCSSDDIGADPSSTLDDAAAAIQPSTAGSVAPDPDPAPEGEAASAMTRLCVMTTHQELADPAGGTPFPSFLTFTFEFVGDEYLLTAQDADLHDGNGVDVSATGGVGEFDMGIRAYGDYFLPELTTPDGTVALPADAYTVDDDEGTASEVCHDLA